MKGPEMRVVEACFHSAADNDKLLEVPAESDVAATQEDMFQGPEILEVAHGMK